jgi:hypothetical protein
MATYQATAGQKVFYSTAYAMSSPTELVGLTSTPDKGGEPDTVDLSIISEKFTRQLAGQQSMDIMTYEYAPDFTATTGSIDVIAGFLAAGEVWIYEEYVEGTDSESAHVLGAGVLYKGRAKSGSIGGQTGNDAQSAAVYVQLTGNSIYVCSGGANPTYKDVFTGATVTTPV